MHPPRSRWGSRSPRRCSSTSPTCASTTRPQPCRCCPFGGRFSRPGRCSRTAHGCSGSRWRRPVSCSMRLRLPWPPSPWCRASQPVGSAFWRTCWRASCGGRSSRERNGALVSVFGLVVLAVSLAGGSGAGGEGSTGEILLWLAATAAAAALLVVGPGRGILGVGVANGIAGGLFFSIGDISTEVATQGEDARLLFVVPLILGYTLGTWLLQLGYQRSGALTVAGVATLLTNALPIAAGTVVFGGLRILAFAAVTIGAIFLARPRKSQATDE